VEGAPKLEPQAPALLDSVLEIAKERRAILAKMRGAVLRKDVEVVFECAEQLTGVSNPEVKLEARFEKSH
jgi:hypothetical protein